MAIDHHVILLDPAVAVDCQVLGMAELSETRASMDSNTWTIALLRNELLPGWDEEWLIVERERVRQLRMRRLERLSYDYLLAGKVAAAIDAAYASIEIEPFRESAHLALIEAHVVDGNHAEAAREVARLSALMDGEMGIAPSPRFMNRLAALGLNVSSESALGLKNR